VGVEKLAFSRKQQNSGIQNALKTEGIAYDASSRKFHFREFSERVLQTATRFVTNNPPIWEISDSTSMTMSRPETQPTPPYSRSPQAFPRRSPFTQSSRRSSACSHSRVGATGLSLLLSMSNIRVVHFQPEPRGTPVGISGLLRLREAFARFIFRYRKFLAPRRISVGTSLGTAHTPSSSHQLVYIVQTESQSGSEGKWSLATREFGQNSVCDG